MVSRILCFLALALSLQSSASEMSPNNLDGDWRLVASSCANRPSETGRTDVEAITIQGDRFWYTEQADSRAVDPECTLKASGLVVWNGQSIRLKIESSNSCTVRISQGVDSSGRTLVANLPVYPRITALNNPSWSFELFMGQDAIVELSTQPQLCPKSKYKAVFTRLGSF